MWGAGVRALELSARLGGGGLQALTLSGRLAGRALRSCSGGGARRMVSEGQALLCTAHLGCRTLSAVLPPPPSGSSCLLWAAELFLGKHSGAFSVGTSHARRPGGRQSSSPVGSGSAVCLHPAFASPCLRQSPGIPLLTQMGAVQPLSVSRARAGERPAPPDRARNLLPWGWFAPARSRPKWCTSGSSSCP